MRNRSTKIELMKRLDLLETEETEIWADEDDSEKTFFNLVHE